MTESDQVDRIDQVLCATLDISPHSLATSRIQSRRNVSIPNWSHIRFFFWSCSMTYNIMYIVQIGIM